MNQLLYRKVGTFGHIERGVRLNVDRVLRYRRQTIHSAVDAPVPDKVLDVPDSPYHNHIVRIPCRLHRKWVRYAH